MRSGIDDRNQDHDLLVAARSRASSMNATIGSTTDAYSVCRIRRGTPGSHSLPFPFELLALAFCLSSPLVDHHGDRDDLLAERERLGEGVAGQPRHAGHRDDHEGALALGLAGTVPIPSSTAGPLCSRRRSGRRGRRRPGRRPPPPTRPAANFETRKMSGGQRR